MNNIDTTKLLGWIVTTGITLVCLAVANLLTVSAAFAKMGEKVDRHDKILDTMYPQHSILWNNRVASNRNIGTILTQEQTQ